MKRPTCAPPSFPPPTASPESPTAATNRPRTVRLRSRRQPFLSTTRANASVSPIAAAMTPFLMAVDHASHAFPAIAAPSSSVDGRKRGHIALRSRPRLVCRRRSRWLAQTCPWRHCHDAGREHPSERLVEALSRGDRSRPSRPIIVQQPPIRIGIPLRVSPAGGRCIKLPLCLHWPPIVTIEASSSGIFVLACGARCTKFCCDGPCG